MFARCQSGLPTVRGAARCHSGLPRRCSHQRLCRRLWQAQHGADLCQPLRPLLQSVKLRHHSVVGAHRLAHAQVVLRMGRHLRQQAQRLAVRQALG